MLRKKCAVVSSPRKIPFQLMDKVKVELGKLEEQEIIIKVPEPSEFVNPIVLVTKPNKNIRICVDSQKLNATLLHEQYRLPIFELQGKCMELPDFLFYMLTKGFGKFY